MVLNDDRISPNKKRLRSITHLLSFEKEKGYDNGTLRDLFCIDTIIYFFPLIPITPFSLPLPPVLPPGTLQHISPCHI